MAPTHQRATLCEQGSASGFNPFCPVGAYVWQNCERTHTHTTGAKDPSYFDEQEVKSSYQYVLDPRERLNDTLKLAKEQLESSQVRQKKIFRQENKGEAFQSWRQSVSPPPD